MNKQQLIERLEEDINESRKAVNKATSSRVEGYWTGTLDMARSAQTLVMKLDEPQKVKVPSFVADWIDICKNYGSIIDLMDGTLEIRDEPAAEFFDWVNENENADILARAWLDGYAVEQESTYQVRLPFTTWNEDSSKLDEEEIYLGFDITSDETRFLHVNRSRKDFRTELTEKEIKSIDERYWAFAVPVEPAEMAE